MNVAARVAAPEMNRGEAAYELWLRAQLQAGRLQWYAYEPVTLRLAKGAHYTPDFQLVTAEGQVECHEVKGWHRNDQAWRVRIKVAASRNPWMRFVVARKNGAGWKLEEIKA